LEEKSCLQKVENDKDSYLWRAISSEAKESQCRKEEAKLLSDVTTCASDSAVSLAKCEKESGEFRKEITENSDKKIKRFLEQMKDYKR